jgi:GH15 family glucan-1,4-alpha-glucosidase
MTRIEDYALIGDCETAALVSRTGSIDWLCWPRFDSDACFAALLGDPSHGRWLLAPRDASARISRRYRDDTLILETRFETDAGAVLVIDFMPPRGEAPDLIRLVIGERGEVAMHTELVLRFGYGVAVPWVMRIGEQTWRAIAGPDMTILRTPAPLHGENLKTVADFVVRRGECVPFVLTYQPSHLDAPAPLDVDAALRTTEAYWRDWIAKGCKIGRWSAMVTRSLITLRALIYRPTGGIIAAPTTSLPERIGGERNWDYRYCWLRDTTFTLLALMNAGFYDEATAWRDWLLRAIAGSSDQLQIMYGLAGERRLSEWELAWLPGYENSRPVRIGNEAYAQLQLDVYGEVMDALHQARAAGLAPTEPAWALQRRLLEHLATVWEQPDYGIWEVRGPARHFTYSKIMAWVAFDRAIKDAERYNLKAPIDEWRATRDRIHRQVCERGYDAQRNCFVQSYDSPQLDASLLLLCQLGFLPARDPRILGTIAAIEKSLVRDGLVLRYDTAASDDGLPPGEGVFLACSFWLADAYAMCGRLEQAEELFERLLALANDVGLLAEEYDPVGRRQVGNFPQGFSHLSLITTAFNLCQVQKPAEQRSNRPVPSQTSPLK